ncbi:N-acetyltransferase [Pelosinus sp. sgz500959]|uniref:N-acetyltransferase n=1 Tax=Pelosinus sp. sgz500959 TaxID=3242472 RepID=UPI00366DB315
MIDKFNKNELDEVMNIWLNTNIDAHDFIPKDYWIKNYNVVKEQYIPIAKTFVYKENNIIIAFISIIEASFIGALFVKKEYQRQGIGLKLINHCKTLYPILKLAVYVDNINSVKFYKRCNFKVKAEQDNESSGFKEYIMSWDK